MTQQEIADALGISRQKVWNYLNSALKKIQIHMGVTEPRRGSRSAKPKKQRR